MALYKFRIIIKLLVKAEVKVNHNTVLLLCWLWWK